MPHAFFEGSWQAVVRDLLGLLVQLRVADHVARDVFSRMVMGAREVLKIAPAATVFAFMVGVTLGLPAGYFGGKLDTFDPKRKPTC